MGGSVGRWGGRRWRVRDVVGGGCRRARRGIGWRSLPRDLREVLLVFVAVGLSGGRLVVRDVGAVPAAAGGVCAGAGGPEVGAADGMVVSADAEAGGVSGEPGEEPAVWRGGGAGEESCGAVGVVPEVPDDSEF